MKQPAPTSRRWEKGQALLEFAFIAPVILVFLFIIVDFGILLDRREVLQHAVREGARRGAVAASITEIVQATTAQSQGILNDADVTVCYVDVDSDGIYGEAGDGVRVTADYTYPFTMGGTEMLTAFGVPVPTIHMDPSADMRLESSVTVAAAYRC